MFRSRSRTIASAALLAAVTLAGAAGAGVPSRFRYQPGETVRFEGVVADAAGQPLAGVQVALEASNPRFDWRQRERVTGPVERVTTTSDERGRFAIDWPWNGDQRRFELVAGIEVPGAGATVRELARLEVSDRVARGSPVVAALVVESAAFVGRLRAFLADLESDDQRRVYAELGLPESVDRVESAAGVESAWWYFAAGRVARFRDGRLTGVESFAPIRPLGEDGGR